MPGSLYMSNNCIFYKFWYFDMFCEKCAYLSRKRESKCKVWKSGVQTATAARCTATAGARRSVLCSGPPRKFMLGNESRPATAGVLVAAHRRRYRDSGLQRGDRRRRCGGPPGKVANPIWPRFGLKIYYILKIFSFYNEEWIRDSFVT